MEAKGKGGILLFLMWAGIGFLGGLTASVAAAPRYFPEVAQTASTVYNAGLNVEEQAASGDKGTPESEAGESTAATGEQKEAEIFTTLGCIQCHKVSAYNVKGGETGPDLSNAYHNVPARYGKTLEEFLWNPEGTMAEILRGREITDEEKTIILELLTRVAEGGPDEGAPAPTQEQETNP
ncbi:cytochrome C [Thermanaeromonas sp. C210]|uniref:cytochrome C n=1 Tax=Thermanaeromonas sp. C210 TaxID=2731925 RepID=UPI00155B787A|nr:cytochrome C [Thermanaeromonas sp. C210]GFN22835.1 hypothetical protein TAMC210_11520 [Thermanaeromonas sp. C210]